MPAYFKSSFKDFISLSATTFVGELTIANSQASTRFQLAPEAIDAWRLQLNPLQTGISEFLSVYPSSQDSSILLEYPIPIIGKRIDAVILIGNIVVVVETKTGEAASPAVRQVEDYALNLACFHETCNHRTIVPLVISAASSGAAGGTSFDDLIEDTIVIAPSDFGRSLCEIAKAHLRPGELQMAADTFDHGRFKPIPRIIDAAVGLYHDMNVFEIGHACAAEDSLNRTTNALVRAVLTARERNKKIICFVTGVPGAGKTLVGLNAGSHEPEIRNVGSFLSGNGPLVKIMQEALVRDIVERSRRTDQPVTRADASLRVRAFIYNVHRFVDEHRDVCPTRKVVVFDEAQRAWDKAENEKAGRVGSEPEMMLDVVGRHEDWAVIIALVGGGQEINRGEAGLAEWGRSLQAYADWEIFASPQVLNGGDSVAGFRLFDRNAVDPTRLHEESELHLTIATRAISAKQISEWVNALLEGKDSEARKAAEQMEAKPLVLRDLSQLRTWLRVVREGNYTKRSSRKFISLAFASGWR